MSVDYPDHTDCSGRTNLPEQNDFFKSNMRLLKTNFPNIWKIMNKTGVEPEGKIIFAPNGEPNLWTKDINGNEVSLHIPENPGAEINDIAGTVKENFAGTLIITGMGLGYCPVYIINHRKNLRHFAIFEPNAGIFLQALKVMDLSTLFSDPRVILSIGENQDIAAAMAPAIKALQLEDIRHIKHNPSFSLDFPKYNALYKDINNYTSSANIEGNTFLKMGNDFFVNRLKHLNSIHHDYMFDDLKGKFKGIPAIIVAAGPSLDMNIHILKQAENKAIILAVDSALPTLVANDIMPNFVTTIDPLELIFEKVASVASQVHDVSMISMSWASSKMAKLFPAEKIFWCFGGKFIEKWMATLVGCKTLTSGATSVAHLNLQSAIWMGCSPVVFMGQDLSFSRSKSHSSAMTLPTKDLINKLLKDEKDIVWLDGIDGGKVPSNRGFHVHKRYFETIIKQSHGYYINATAQGCHIEGTEIMPLQEVIHRYCQKKINMAPISNLSTGKDPSVLREHIMNKLRKKVKTCRQIQRMLKETQLLLTDLFKILDKHEKSKKQFKNLNDFPVTFQRKITRLDKIGKKLDNAVDIWPLMQEVTMAGLRKSEQQKHAIDLLADNPELYIKWMKKSLQRLDTINKVRKKLLPLLLDTVKEDINVLESEAKLSSALGRHKTKEEYSINLIKLVRLYFDTGNINLAQPWLKKLSEILPDSGETNFFRGITAAHYTEYDKAESFFDKACKADPAFITQIEEFRRRQGDAYVRYAPVFDQNDRTVARKLLLKGLIYAPEHKTLKQELKLRGDMSIKEIKQHEKTGKLFEIENMIDSWLDDLSSIRGLTSIIGTYNVSQLYYYKGLILINKKRSNSAVGYLNKALDFMPENPRLHILLTDIYFEKQEYPEGIYHLKQAVSLDSAYAVYWEEIGDSLVKTGQYEDAVAAFENCFLILPERVYLLKKIGDCYQKTGQLEAAREAYMNLKSMLKKS